MIFFSGQSVKWIQIANIMWRVLRQLLSKHHSQVYIHTYYKVGRLFSSIELYKFYSTHYSEYELFSNEHFHGWIVFCWSLPYIKCNSRIKSRYFTQYDKSEKICSTKQFFGIYYFKSKYVIRFSISCIHDFALFFIILAHCILTNNGRARDRDWERECSEWM